MKRLMIAAAAAAGLGGCAGPAETVPEPRPPALAGPAPAASYCYQTLGRVDCYRTPREGDTLLGVDIQPPR